MDIDVKTIMDNTGPDDAFTKVIQMSKVDINIDTHIECVFVHVDDDVDVDDLRNSRDSMRHRSIQT